MGHQASYTTSRKLSIKKLAIQSVSCIQSNNICRSRDECLVLRVLGKFYNLIQFTQNKKNLCTEIKLRSEILQYKVVQEYPVQFLDQIVFFSLKFYKQSKTKQGSPKNRFKLSYAQFAGGAKNYSIFHTQAFSIKKEITTKGLLISDNPQFKQVQFIIQFFDSSIKSKQQMDSIYMSFYEGYQMAENTPHEDSEKQAQILQLIYRQNKKIKDIQTVYLASSTHSEEIQKTQSTFADEISTQAFKNVVNAPWKTQELKTQILQLQQHKNRKTIFKTTANNKKTGFYQPQFSNFSMIEQEPMQIYPSIQQA